MWPAPPFGQGRLVPGLPSARGRDRRSGVGRKRADELYRAADPRWIHQGPGRTAQSRARAGDDADGKAASMAVIGYRLRREFYSDDFSNGIENILINSQSGLNSPVVRPHRQAEGFSLERLAAPRHRQRAHGRLESGCRIHRCGGPPGVVDGRRQRVSARPLQQPLGAEPRRGPARRASEGQAIDPRSGRCPDAANAARAGSPPSAPARARRARSTIACSPRPSRTAPRWSRPISSTPMRLRSAGARAAPAGRPSILRSPRRRG